MEYGRVLNRSVNIVWQNKFLIVLGILAALGSGSLGGGGGVNGSSGSGDPGQFTGFEEEFAALAAGAIIGIVCVLILVALIFWVISTIARGGMIASVDDIESGEKTSFRKAWGAGWSKAWRLLGIGIIPSIPGIVLFVLMLLSLGAFGGVYALFGEEVAAFFGAAEIAITLVAICCIAAPIIILLNILKNFAERACMIEDLGVIDSYRRGAKVLTANLGEAIILFILQLVIFLILGALFLVPGLFLALCCFFWPLLLVVQGAITAFLTTLWTLAWRSWTGEDQIVAKEPSAV